MARASVPDPLGALTQVITAGLPGPDGSVKPLLEALFGERYAKRHAEPTMFRDAGG